MSVQLSVVLTQARTYLNDDNSLQFQDPVIIPKIQQAHQELQLELQNIGSPLIRGLSSVLSVVSSTSPTVLTFASTPPMPADLLVPTSIFESTSANMAGAKPITEVLYLPLPYTQSGTGAITMWSWQEETLVLNPASAQAYIQIMYKRMITLPVLATDPIGVLNGEFFLAARAAAMVAGTLDGAKDMVDSLNTTAAAKLKSLLTNNRGSQRPIMKP